MSEVPDLTPLGSIRVLVRKGRAPIRCLRSSQGRRPQRLARRSFSLSQPIGDTV